MRIRTTTLLLATLLLATACGGTSDGVDVTGSTAATPPEGIWFLTSSAPEITIPEDTRATLVLEVIDGRTMGASGDTPCNGFGGEVTFTADGGWSWGEVAVTEMGCEEPRMSAQQTYLDALLGTSTWSLADDALVLTGDGVELTFALRPPVEAAGLVGTDWVLTGFVDGDAVSTYEWEADDAWLRLDGDEAGGTFTLFSGCRDFAGEWVAEGDTIRWPSWGRTDDSRGVDACSESELESEQLVLAAVEGGFTVVRDVRDVGSFLTIRSAADSDTGLAFRGPQDGQDEGCCDPAEDPDDAPAEQAVQEEEICFSAIAMSTDGSGAATQDAAMEELVTTGAFWWDPPAGVTFEGTTLLYRGERIGSASLFQFDDGTWAVSGIDVCFTPDPADVR